MTSREELLDLLSEWQSLEAILPEPLKAKVVSVNRRTIEVLEEAAYE